MRTPNVESVKDVQVEEDSDYAEDRFEQSGQEPVILGRYAACGNESEAAKEVVEDSQPTGEEVDGDGASAPSDYNDYLVEQAPDVVEEGRVVDYIQYKAASSVNTGQ